MSTSELVSRKIEQYFGILRNSCHCSLLANIERFKLKRLRGGDPDLTVCSLLSHNGDDGSAAAEVVVSFGFRFLLQDPFQLENGNPGKFLLRQKSMHGLKCRAKVAETVDVVENQKKTVLVMGGTGRVGASTLRALAKGDDLHLIVGGRNREKGEALARDLGGCAEFSGKEQRLKAYSARRVVDFGKGTGKKPVYLLNLPEVRRTFEVLTAPSVSARFGTSPQIWNVAMGLVATFVPKEILQDQKKVQSLVKWSDIALRAVDGIAGECVSMRVDLECENGKKAIGIFSHKMLSVSVGVSVAAFARAALEGATQLTEVFCTSAKRCSHTHCIPTTTIRLRVQQNLNTPFSRVTCYLRQYIPETILNT